MPKADGTGEERGRSRAKGAAAAGRTSPSARKRVRLRPEDRERLIAREAVRYFAEVGFNGDTRELARRLGVGQALLFRYFPTKESLIERVYQEVFVRRWNPYWEIMIEDRSLPLKQRMINLYKDYAQTIIDEEWIKIFLFAGFKRSGINERFLKMVRERMVIPLCRELRHEYRLPSAAEVPITPMEQELVIGINGRIFYLGVRKFVYGTQVLERIDRLVEAEIEIFFGGAPALLAKLLGKGDRQISAAKQETAR